MIIPSVDIINGHAVQLIGGKEKAIDAGDPRPIAKKFGRVGEIALIDLDAARSCGNNQRVMLDIVKGSPCRVGGGIRDVKSAVQWLDAGARKVILGTAAVPEVLRELPKERVIAALDAHHDQVVVEGWERPTGQRIEDRMDELRDDVSGFLVTFVECEGRMEGMPFDRIQELKEYAGECELTVAGGVQTPEDVARADRIGVDAQVGMALYSNRFDLADGFCASLRSDRADKLWPTIVSNEHGITLGLVYSNLESIRMALDTGRGVYFSRSRGGLWVKGEQSGNTQELLRIEADCDRDALQFVVRQQGSGFCHTGTQSCFGGLHGIKLLEQSVVDRKKNAPHGSYTRRLLNENGLLRSKLIEEANELADSTNASEAAHEFADLIYFGMVHAVKNGASLFDVEKILDARSFKVTRRPGNAKENVSGARDE